MATTHPHTGSRQSGGREVARSRIQRSAMPINTKDVQKVLFKANQVIKPFAGLFFFIKNAERWIGRFI
ncbi:MAG: hypothetical protein WCI87_08470, partial [Euryarchaeota archaeon]